MKKQGHGWKEVERLINEQKYEAASAEVQKIREQARKKKDDGEITRALIKEVQLRLGLHGYETSVRFLREEPWPPSPLARLVLNLYYGWNILQYLNAYSWEINQREKVASGEKVDLKAWTRDQLFAEALSAYGQVWAERAALGNEPATLLDEYINTGNYPDRVRGSLRDAVSYLTIDLLQNTSFWSPAQSNDIFRLNLAKLISGQAPRAFRLDDPALHPIEVTGAILDDLEAWHKAAGRVEAAYEARLERYRRLSASFSNASDRKLVREALAASQKTMRSHEWWGEGQALLAEWVRDQEGDRVRARALADEGRRAYPGTYGGQRCEYIVREIEAPSYQLQAMSHDALGKRSIVVKHKNLEALYFRAYRLDLIPFIEQQKDHRLMPDYQAVKPLLERKADAEWQVALPKTPDYELHQTHVTPPLREKGLWVVLASARADFALSPNKASVINFVVSDLVLLTRTAERERAEVSVIDGPSGKPVVGARVMLYVFDWQKKHHEVASETSDASGLARFKLKPNESVFVIAKRDRDVSIDPHGQYFYGRRESAPASDLIYTDRAIYRPEQTIMWKVVSYEGNAERTSFKIRPNRTFDVELRDANNDRVLQQQVTTNEFGSASGRFVIPKGRLLGAWSLHTSGGGYGSVRVEEYKRPTFEVTLAPSQGEARLNQPVTLKGEAKYYFGLPVQNGTVKWRVTRERHYPWWWFWYHGDGGGGGAVQQIASGNAALKPDGGFEVQFTPEADPREDKALTYTYTLYADLTDEGGETRSAVRSLRLGLVAVEASVEMATGFFLDDRDAELVLVRRNLDGVGQAGKAKARIVAIKQPEQTPLPADVPSAAARKKDGFSTPGDALRPRAQHGYDADQLLSSWDDGAEVRSAAIEHDKEGRAKLALGKLAPGAYRVRYQTQDSFGATYETWKNFIVAGKGKALPLKLPFLVLPYESRHEPGKNARVLVSSGLKDQAIMFERTRRGKVLERRWLGPDDAGVLELAVSEEDRGGFALQAHLVRDHQAVSQAVGVAVPWDDKALDVSFSTFRDLLRPGQKETWRISVKGKASQKVEAKTAEILAYMYDKSLDQFAAHAPTSPLSLYGSFSSAAPWRVNLSLVYEAMNLGDSWFRLPGYPTYQGASLKFYSSYGIGGMGSRRFGHGGVRAKREADGGLDDLRSGSPPPAAAAPEAERSAAKKDKNAEAPARQVVQGLLEAPADGSPQAPAPQLRSNFAETAFFSPHLITGADGSASIEFTVPDSVTAYKVWAVGITRDLRSGSVSKEAKAVKDLMVRPYMPRFLREGDAAELKIVVNNAGQTPLKGEVMLEIIDPETQKSIARDFAIDKGSTPFSVAPNGGTNVSFTLRAPKRVGTAAFRVVAKAGEWSDGELRPIPVLPSRMHLAQSRFVTLRDKQKRSMTFDDLAKSDDPTLQNEKLVVTLDAQLFYTVLKALPYLIEFPYECAEQVQNRFVSAGILSSLYKQFPAVAEMAKTMSQRKTRLESFAEPDPNRRMTLEESPWLQEARGGEDIPDTALLNVLDPAVAKRTRDTALAQLKKMQLPSGAFPWFPGGPPSPWITLYLMYGFAKAAEFQVDIPKDMVVRGWRYVASWFKSDVERMMADDCCWEFVSFLNYTLTAYPDESWGQEAFSKADRTRMLDFSFRHWKAHSPMLKAYLALTLKRMGREKDGRLVFASVMDSAKTKEDQGTFWAPEDRAWLWYNDTIESHALALRTLTELMPEEPKRDGLVLWLLLNKKLNHWKSTRATSEVIYSLAHHMKADKSLGVREAAKVTVGDEATNFVFEPNKYVGKTQLVYGPDKVSPKLATISVEKETKGFMFASATWHFSTDKLPAEARGDFFQVTRTYFRRENTGKEWVLKPLAEGAVLEPGAELEVHLSLKSKHAAEYVHLRDPRGAGFEPEGAVSKYKWDLGLVYYEEFRDSGTNFFFEKLPAGEYTFKYRVRVAMAGTFRVGPAVVQPMYAPEFVAYSQGHVLRVAGK